MHFSLGTLIVGIALLLRLPPLAGGAATNTTRTLVTQGKPHTFPESYQFDPRDGWEPVMVTNLRYKYRRSLAPFPEVSSVTTPGKNSSSALKRPSKGSTGEHSSRKSVFRSLGKSIAESMKGIIGIGKAERVMITWFGIPDTTFSTPAAGASQDGHPRYCYRPTSFVPAAHLHPFKDQSFVAALTLDGWTGKPQCFDFLELCSTSSQCTFARVVDSCAGCEEGSKHVDLTRAAFQKLGSLEEGVLTVWMRRASEPVEWDEALWGPKDD